MAFRGQHEHNLDAKDRLTIPARRRAQFADGVVLSAGLDGCVQVWPRDGFDRHAARIQAGLNPLSAKGRMLRLQIHANAEDEELDAAGRVRVARHLVAHAGLEGPCVVVGSGDHLQVWSAERWAELSARLQAEAHAAAEELSGANWPAGE